VILGATLLLFRGCLFEKSCCWSFLVILQSQVQGLSTAVSCCRSFLDIFYARWSGSTLLLCRFYSLCQVLCRVCLEPVGLQKCLVCKVALMPELFSWKRHNRKSRRQWEPSYFSSWPEPYMYTVHLRYLWQGNRKIYGHIQCIYTVLANPIYKGKIHRQWFSRSYFLALLRYGFEQSVGSTSVWGVVRMSC